MTTLQSTATSQSTRRRLPVGAETLPDEAGVSFRVWAPKRKKVEVVFENASAPDLPLAPDGDEGHYVGVSREARAGMRYQFRLDDGDRLYPDPVTKYQPTGPHGFSEIIDPLAFSWTDDEWTGVSPLGQVLYEMHIGTFTREGTWASAIEQLAALKEVGVTCLEVMPIAEWTGAHNWGYDGVCQFAPTNAYGSPDDFRRFVDRAHALGLGVILDVVYNHFGPDGCYIREFANEYLSSTHKNDWGDSINFDGEGSAGVREFFVANAHYWIEEFHLDGFRFDATQAIVDDSPRHILADIANAARAASRTGNVYLINENEPQLSKLVRPVDQGGYGLDALWNDDFHHSAIVSLTGRNEAYRSDYFGRPQEFISAAKWGYLFQGQIVRWQWKRRGTPARDLPPTAFVNYIQNHDQIANTALCLRAHQLASPAHVRAMTALLLLCPQTPMLFMGQEWAASSPFHYFTDHGEHLAPLIRDGRARELSQFPSVAQPEILGRLVDPSGPDTFTRCKLNHDERALGIHAQMWKLHKDLLSLRRELPAMTKAQRTGDIDGAVLGTDQFLLRFFGEEEIEDRLLVVNFGQDLHLFAVPEPLLASEPGMRWEIEWSSEHPDYGGGGTPPLETLGEDWRIPGENWTLPGRSAVLLRPVKLDRPERLHERELHQAREQEKHNAQEQLESLQ